MTTDLTHAAFSKNLDSEFSVKDDTLGQNLKLIHVSERKASPPYEQFSIMFCGDVERALKQGMFQLEHPAMGAFDIFLVPVKRDEQGMHYEAIFNYLAEA
jgi:hypothetical protein